jgi:predicted ATPase with chaperone activity
MEYDVSTPTASQTLAPPAPTSVSDTGLSLGFLTDLALKIMYLEGNLSGLTLSERLALPYNGVVDAVLDFLKREQLVEVKGADGFSEVAYQYAISEKGRDMAREALSCSQYAGPAPVTLTDYTQMVRSQPLSRVGIRAGDVRQALAHLVIGEDTLSQLGPAVNSARSIFVYGHPGNGKTAIGEGIGRMIQREWVYIPYAIEVGGQVITVYDRTNHVRWQSSAGRSNSHDSRWVLVRRPVIVTGGELTLESLDLVYDEARKYYEAPFQVKANCGMLLIDDFGRQQARPRDLLNRWIVPLEKGIDFLALHTGRKIEVPFDVLIVFSTNLAPHDLVDESFLRRIRHKIEIKNPTWDNYREIFRRECERNGVQYTDAGLAYLIQQHYLKPHREKRACHPRDIVEQMTGIARYLDIQPSLTDDLIDRACQAYFVEI